MARILIADDELAMREMIALACRLDGHDVVQAYDTGSAIAMYMAQTPDLLVLDLSMPGGGGTEVVGALRGGGVRLCPIVVVTGYLGSVPERMRAGLGAFAFLEKPFAIDSLRETVRNALATTKRA
jgi:DNA-binding response OmpR family regulator